MILLYLIKLFIFNYLFSFIAGIAVIPFALLFGNSKSPDKKISTSLELIIGLLIVGLQSSIIAKATQLCLTLDPSRINILWYLIGFVFCTPLALTKREAQTEYSWILVLASYVIYVVCLVFDIDNYDFINLFARYLSV